MKPQINFDVDKLIEHVGKDHCRDILDILGLDPQDILQWPDIANTAEWHCGVEDRWWPIRAAQFNLSDLYAIRFTATDEAGIDDMEIIERVDDETDATSLTEWLHEIAADCGSCDGQIR